jgi:hypothetical protein
VSSLGTAALLPDPDSSLTLAPGRAVLRPTRRRLTTIWALLFFNVLSYNKLGTVLPIPSTVGKLLTQGALVGALILALTINPKVIIRPNVLLALFSVLAITSTMMSVRFVTLGTDYRAVRLVLFIAVLWLLTPWWGREDMALLHIHFRVLLVAVGSVVVGAVLAHHKAFSYGGRLGGTIWPMPPTQVAHYAAELTGLAVLFWLCRMVSRRWMLAVVIPSVAVLLLSHTRTALIGIGAGLLVAGLSLFSSRRRARRAFAAMIVVAVAAWSVSPVISTWLARGENSQELGQLTGRTKVWTLVFSNPRPEPNVILGSGLSNDSFNGLAIDSSWVATYEDQGIVGDVLDGAILLVLLLIALLRPRGPARAMALYLIVYCLVASFFETGLGNASTYALDLAVAASLLAIPSA